MADDEGISTAQVALMQRGMEILNSRPPLADEAATRSSFALFGGSCVQQVDWKEDCERKRGWGARRTLAVTVSALVLCLLVGSMLLMDVSDQALVPGVEGFLSGGAAREDALLSGATAKAAAAQRLAVKASAFQSKPAPAQILKVVEATPLTSLGAKSMKVATAKIVVPKPAVKFIKAGEPVLSKVMAKPALAKKAATKMAVVAGSPVFAKKTAVKAVPAIKLAVQEAPQAQHVQNAPQYVQQAPAKMQQQYAYPPQAQTQQPYVYQQAPVAAQPQYAYPQAQQPYAYTQGTQQPQPQQPYAYSTQQQYAMPQQPYPEYQPQPQLQQPYAYPAYPAPQYIQTQQQPQAQSQAMPQMAQPQMMQQQAPPQQQLVLVQAPRAQAASQQQAMPLQASTLPATEPQAALQPAAMAQVRPALTRMQQRSASSSAAPQVETVQQLQQQVQQQRLAASLPPAVAQQQQAAVQAAAAAAPPLLVDGSAADTASLQAQAGQMASKQLLKGLGSDTPQQLSLRQQMEQKMIAKFNQEAAPIGYGGGYSSGYGEMSQQPQPQYTQMPNQQELAGAFGGNSLQQVKAQANPQITRMMAMGA